MLIALSALGNLLPQEPSFFAGWASAMNIGSIILLIVGAILLICEMLLPGVGIAGVCGAIACVAGLIIGSNNIAQAGFTFAILLIVLLIAALIIFKFIFGKRKKSSKLVLTEDISQNNLGSLKRAESLIGKEGIALTALRPSGTIEVDGNRIDAVADGEFIAKGERVIIAYTEGIRTGVVRAGEAGK